MSSTRACLLSTALAVALCACTAAPTENAADPEASDPAEAPADPDATSPAETPEPDAPAPDPQLAEPFGEATLTLSGGGSEVPLGVYVADTPDLRRRGLMGWESLPDDTGMIFVFEEDSTSGFWMKDTLIDLSIAFIDADGQVRETMDMQPCPRDPCPTYAPEDPYRYALEVEQGVFDRIGLDTGWRVEGLQTLGR